MALEPSYCYKAKIDRVVDGDTVYAFINVGFNISIYEKIRIAKIDTPEIYGVKKDTQEYEDGMRAKDRLVELIEGKDVIVRTELDKKGKYGRYIAEIFVDGSSVGDILLSEGLARIY